MVRGLQKIDLANARLGSSEMVRDINCDIVLEVVRANQPISRAHIARVTGLQASTVSNIVDQLIGERWVRESGVARSAQYGRPPTLVRLNDKLAMVAADVRPRRATVAVVDLNGRFLAQKQLQVTSSPRKTVAGVIEAMLRMKKALPQHVFKGVGVAVPGRVDPETGRLRFAPNLGWEDFDIKGAMERGTRMPVVMDNEANACLLAEMWFGNMNGSRNVVLVSISEGIGAAILSNGELIYGKNNMAGEFGHLPLDVNGPQCHCSGRGCWEMYASSSAALRYYAATQAGAPAESIEELLQLAAQKNAAALAALSKQAEFIGRGLRLISAAVAPQTIMIAGDILPVWKHVAPVIAKWFAKGALTDVQPKIVPSQQANAASLRGAAILVLQRHGSAKSVRSRGNVRA